MFLDIECFDEFLVLKKFLGKEIHTTVDIQVGLLPALCVMNHLIRFWVLIECTHFVVFCVVIIRRHDSQECLRAILEFEHII